MKGSVVIGTYWAWSWNSPAFALTGFQEPGADRHRFGLLPHNGESILWPLDGPGFNPQLSRSYHPVRVSWLDYPTLPA